MKRNIIAILLTCFSLIGIIANPSLGAETKSFRTRMESQSTPYVPQYYWFGGLNDQLSQELYEDYLRLGMNAIQRDDYDSFKGAHKFVAAGKNGFMWQTNWWNQDLQLGKTGEPLDIGMYGCVSSDRNIQSGINTILGFIKEHRPDLYKVGGRYLFCSWDETGLQYSKYCQCDICIKLFGQYLQKEVYKDSSPSQDTNQNGKTLNSEARVAFTDWSSIPLPQFENRYQTPVMWKFFIDFTSWKMARFISRIEQGVNKAGESIDYLSFYPSNQYWPGQGPQQGTTPYYQAKNSPVLTNEFCIADWPISSIASSWNDRLSREYGKAVFDYSWFWPGFKDGGKDYFTHGKWAYERGLARKMGHTLHGLQFWHYDVRVWDHMPKQYAEVAYWNHFFQKHWGFLKKSEPTKPQIAVLWPGYASAFYSYTRFPNTDFGFGPQAFIEAQYPFTVIQEEEVEAGILKDFKALYVFGVERTTQEVLDQIDKFIGGGGYVFSDADSLLMKMDGSRSDLLKTRFGIDVQKKYKSPFWPTILSAEDEAWANSNDPVFGKVADKQSADSVQQLKETTTGLQQTTLDIDSVNLMTVAPNIIPTRLLRTYNDIVTGVLSGGKKIGEYRGEISAVETEHTVWFGNRPGSDISAVFPRDIINEWGLPLYKNGNAPGWNDSEGAAERSDYRKIITCLAEKAGIQRPALVMRDGLLAPHIEVAVKTDSRTGGRMIILVNHEDIGGLHHVDVKGIPSGFEAWDVTNNRLIEKNTDGKFPLNLQPWRARVLFVGPSNQTDTIVKKQRELMNLDLSPVKFTVGPKTLSEGTLAQIRQAPEPRVISRKTGEVARLTVTVSNKDKNQPRIAEPVIIPGRVLAAKLRTLSVRGIRLASSQDVQWDDLDHNGILSRPDEIVWQTDLKPGEKKTFTLILRDQTVVNANKTGFTLSSTQDEARVQVDGKDVFAVGKDNSWLLPEVSTETRHPGARFFDGGEAKDSLITKLGDGPVRKLIEVSNNYVTSTTGDADRGVRTNARYAVYARQASGESRIYTDITHSVDKDINGSKEPPAWYIPAGRQAGLGTGKGWYKDTLGRVGPLCSELTGSEPMEKNFGGWIAIKQGKDKLLGILARRTEGIVTHKASIPDETDGIQVIGNWLTRSALDWNTKDVRKMFDREILAGNVFHLEALLVIKNGTTWQGIDKSRREYANPPEISIDSWTVETAGL